MPNKNKLDDMDDLRNDLGDFLDDGDMKFASNADDRLLGISMETGHDKWEAYYNEGRTGSRYVSLIY